ncbi:MAG: DUF4157 domain-containing protein [Thaumarchaeota archaeon]|nr:DUF4157 domain-containing protein [Nitrososphaerota archaeon]MCL5317213.1 DUF4157 domain-containing protein [Nitrososphaerota archaeon]
MGEFYWAEKSEAASDRAWRPTTAKTELESLQNQRYDCPLPSPESGTATEAVAPAAHPFIQAKLNVSQPDDPFEQEADSIANQVMAIGKTVYSQASSVSPDLNQNSFNKHINLEGKENLQRQSLNENVTLQAKQRSSERSFSTKTMENVANAVRGGGQPLPESERAFFEPRFGHDFSKVRVHTDAEAAEVARATNARAYTLGQDIVFGENEYRPSTVEGMRLLAHELTHTVQQDNIFYRQTSTIEKKEIETPDVLARKMREAFRGAGTDEDEVYRILEFPGPTVRAMINYYNDHYNDHTGKGLVEDIYDEFSGDELQKALSLLNKAEIDKNIDYRTTPIPSAVAGEAGKVWVGLIVRGKWSKEHHPGVMEQHADVVVPSAAGEMKTVGYFGDVGTGSSASSGMGLQGISADMNWFLTYRPYYVDLELAKLVDMKSSLILIKATQSQADTLSKYWEDLKADPGTFYILGANCSTAAAAGFEKASVTKEISGLDTPDNLFEQLRSEYKDAYMISGYYGYIKAGRKWAMVGGSPSLVDPGVGPWLGPFITEKILK